MNRYRRKRIGEIKDSCQKSERRDRFSKNFGRWLDYRTEEIPGKKKKERSVLLEDEKPLDGDNALDIPRPVGHNSVGLALLLEHQEGFL